MYGRIPDDEDTAYDIARQRELDDELEEQRNNELIHQDQQDHPQGETAPWL